MKWVQKTSGATIALAVIALAKNNSCCQAFNFSRGLTIQQALERNDPHKAVPYQWWDEEYWLRQDIHTLGNTGITGGLHAAMAPISTRIIDLLAYEGKNVRESIARQLVQNVLSYRKNQAEQCPQAKRAQSDNLKILDLGCGVGMSTAAIASAVQKLPSGCEKTTIIGVDTSPEMLAMARVKDREREGIRTLSPSNNCPAKKLNISTQSKTIETSFVEANAEQTPFPRESFDVVTIMYLLHEAPFLGRHRILREARRLLKPGGILAVVDISPDYEPSQTMLSGEPYVLEYQSNCSSQFSSLRGFESLSKTDIVPGHVVLYELVKSDPWWKRFNGWTQRVTEFIHLHSYIWNRLRISRQPSES